MMLIDLEGDGEVYDFTTVPNGSYVCHVAEVRRGQTRIGDERWAMRLVVAEGEHIGRLAAWDSLVFSAIGRIRTRMVFHALGLPSEGRVEVNPEDLLNRTAFVTVRVAEHMTPNGATVRRNEVRYDGYRKQGSAPTCGHSACRQNWIDTGASDCVEEADA